MTYSYNSKDSGQGSWTSQHQISLNGKRNGFEMSDLVAFGALAGMKERKTKTIIGEVLDVVRHWSEFAQQAKVHDEHITQIKPALRINKFSQGSP